MNREVPRLLAQDGRPICPIKLAFILDAHESYGHDKTPQEVANEEMERQGDVVCIGTPVCNGPQEVTRGVFARAIGLQAGIDCPEGQLVLNTFRRLPAQE